MTSCKEISKFCGLSMVFQQVLWHNGIYQQFSIWIHKRYTIDMRIGVFVSFARVQVIANQSQCSFKIFDSNHFIAILLRRFCTWWRHQMETFSALLAICAGDSPVSGEFPTQRPVTRSFDVFFDVRLIKRLSKHSRGWWFGTLSHPLWRHRNELTPTNRAWSDRGVGMGSNFEIEVWHTKSLI